LRTHRDGDAADAARDDDNAIAVLTDGDESRPPKQEVQMIVMFTARRLKPGAWEQFREAWDPGDARPPGFQRAYHARNIRDEDEVISFGLFDMDEEEYRRWRGEADAQETQRVDRLSAFVEHEYVSGVYEVIDTLDG
jgi:heme-degrading monooxygenase HmoA